MWATENEWMRLTEWMNETDRMNEWGWQNERMRMAGWMDVNDRINGCDWQNQWMRRTFEIKQSPNMHDWHWMNSLLTETNHQTFTKQAIIERSPDADKEPICCESLGFTDDWRDRSWHRSSASVRDFSTSSPWGGGVRRLAPAQDGTGTDFLSPSFTVSFLALPADKKQMDKNQQIASSNSSQRTELTK